jgi:hypothetical protein
VRRWLLQYHVPSLIQLGIIAYAATAWNYWRKVLHPPTLRPSPARHCCWPAPFSTLRLHSTSPFKPCPALSSPSALPCCPHRPHPPAPLPRTSHCVQSLSYASPKALLNALLPQAQLPESAEAGGSAARVAAFKRYIAGGLLAGRRVPAGCLCSRPGMSSVHGVQTSHLQRQGLPSSEAH